VAKLGTKSQITIQNGPNSPIKLFILHFVCCKAETSRGWKTHHSLQVLAIVKLIQNLRSRKRQLEYAFILFQLAPGIAVEQRHLGEKIHFLSFVIRSRTNFDVIFSENMSF
jgi:hypothetical protein